LRKHGVTAAHEIVHAAHFIQIAGEYGVAYVHALVLQVGKNAVEAAVARMSAVVHD